MYSIICTSFLIQQLQTAWHIDLNINILLKIIHNACASIIFLIEYDERHYMGLYLPCCWTIYCYLKSWDTRWYISQLQIKYVKCDIASEKCVQRQKDSSDTDMQTMLHTMSEWTQGKILTWRNKLGRERSNKRNKQNLIVIYIVAFACEGKALIMKAID